jgi:hypothetical protein
MLGTLGALAAASATLLAAPGPAAAQRSIEIQDLHATYYVRTDGTVDVEESYRVRFNGQWNGLLRVLELQPPEDWPWDDPAGFRLREATNANGDPLRTEVDRTGRYEREIRVYVPNANDRTAYVVLEYTLPDALGFYAQGDEAQPAMDEFYWNVTGDGWDVPIRRVTAEVRLPDGVEVMQAAAYQGPAGAEDEVPVTTVGNTARVEARGSVGAGTHFTFGVGWPGGTVTRDPARTMAWAERDLGERLTGARPGPFTYLPLLLPFVVFWLAYRAWDARGRDPKERAIMARWEPPADLSPAEAGTLVDHTPDMHDIISTLVEMAVRGYVVIEERDKEGFLQFGTDYVFHLVRPRSEWGDLRPHQYRFLDGLFKHRESVGEILKDALGMGDDATDGAPAESLDSVKLSDLKNEFYKEIPDIKDAILDALVRKGHYLRRPDKAMQPWLLGAGFMAFVGFGGFAIVADNAPVVGIVTAVAAGISAVILGIFGFVMPARTEKGARTREAALGFKRFLEKVEEPRYNRMIESPDQFEEFLPFAMAFQCQEQWARAFDDLLTEPPDWYHGHRHTHFRPTTFASDMGQMASTAGTAMASSPSSSGSGGGGSAGGGGGGGGGGGF